MSGERWVITEVEHVGWKWTGGRPDPDGLVWRSTTPRFLDDLDLDIDPNDPGDLLLEWTDEHGAVWSPVVIVQTVRQEVRP